MTVFLSGSRKISRLDEAVKSRLSTIVEKGFRVIVGDAHGADKVFQTTLASMDYTNVTVFCSGSECRNNMGQWNVKHVSVDVKLKGRAFYTQKDKAMAGDAGYGLVLWDGESPGSISNVIEMLKRNKRVVVYLSPEKKFYAVSHLDDAKLMILRQSQQLETFEGRIRPTAERLREITEKGAKLRENATEEQLGSFSE